ncbi:MAG: hypothetical protein AAB897_01160 [Patescibacteria group bacterium]
MFSGFLEVANAVESFSVLAATVLILVTLRPARAFRSPKAAFTFFVAAGMAAPLFLAACFKRGSVEYAYGMFEEFVSSSLPT